MLPVRGTHLPLNQGVALLKYPGGTGVRDMKARALRHVVFTLQYCLETFEQTCQCGRCDPCTKGQYDIRTAIHTVENLMEPVTCGCGHTRERSRV